MNAMNQVYVGNTLPKQKHKSVNMFSNSNISKETFDKKKYKTNLANQMII